MTEPSVNLRLRPRIRITLGLFVGLAFGPLLAYLFVHLPSNDWLGAHPGPHIDLCIRMSLPIGFGYGAIVGLGVSLFAWVVQGWRRSRAGKGLTPNLQWPDSARVDEVAQRHAVQIEGGTNDGGNRISRRTDFK